MSISRPTSLARARSRHHSQDSRVVAISDAQALLAPEGDLGQNTTDMLEAISPHPHQRDYTLIEEEDVEDDELEAQNHQPQKPWWKRPSPWWILGAMPLSSIAMATTIAPRVQIYTRLACMAHRPEYMSETTQLTAHIGSLASWNVPSTSYNRTSSFPSSGTTNAVSFILPEADRDPANQPAKVPSRASLIAIMTTTLGILSCVTTAWWGQLSDRWGRTKIMRFVIAGMLFADFNFIAVSLWTDVLPGGYYFLIMSSVVDGLLGGMSTASSTMHAYISDCVEPTHRARMFSMSMGLLFSGMAVGPWLGGKLIAHTGDLLSVFWFAGVIHLCGSLFWIIFVPESLPEDVKQSNITAQAERLAKERSDEPQFSVWKLFKFLRPLKMLLPRPVDPNNHRRGMDWNLTFLAAAHSCAIIVMGSYPYKMAYAQNVFHWGSEELGGWLSTVGVIRASYLLLILPVVIKLFKPRPESIRLEGEETEIVTAPQPTGDSHLPPQSRPQLSTSRGGSLVSLFRGPSMAHPGRFDLYLARGSLLFEIASYVLTMLATTGPSFLAATSLASLGGGFNPAVNSLALLLGGTMETGKLFGAMSVLQTISSQVVGPAVFAYTIIRTATWFPSAIFALCAISLSCSFVFTLLVHLPDIPVASFHRTMGSGRRGHDQDATLVAPSSGGTVKNKKYTGPQPQIVVSED
ncbi:MFS general substrate transporter [Auriculariales sp. MPI-PUGE-AT-0066]|nr:MFS general substrate transporter [Auriculariales sp. MPI-PUGE-AT-0066]